MLYIQLDFWKRYCRMHLFREPLFFSAQEYLQSSHNKPRVHDSLSSLVRRPNIIAKKKNTSFYITSLECPLAYFKQARNASEFQLFFLYFQKKRETKEKKTYWANTPT